MNISYANELLVLLWCQNDGTVRLVNFEGVYIFADLVGH